MNEIYKKVNEESLDHLEDHNHTFLNDPITLTVFLMICAAGIIVLPPVGVYLVSNFVLSPIIAMLTVVMIALIVVLLMLK
jgi:hypothetical protein